jgi:hypothetical protein
VVEQQEEDLVLQLLRGVGLIHESRASITSAPARIERVIQRLFRVVVELVGQNCATLSLELAPPVDAERLRV